jgi:hypothetical protein
MCIYKHMKVETHYHWETSKQRLAIIFAVELLFYCKGHLRKLISKNSKNKKRNYHLVLW